MSGFGSHPNVKAVAEEEGLTGEVQVDTNQAIRGRIVHVLSIYPRISVSMLQIGVGTSMPPTIWKPVMLEMIKEGIIKEERVAMSTPSGRQQVYTVLSLNHQD